MLGSSDGNDDVHEEEAVPTVAPASTTGIVVCLVAFFVHFYCFAIYETIMTPLIPALYVNIDYLFLEADCLFTARPVLNVHVERLLVPFVPSHR